MALSQRKEPVTADHPWAHRETPRARTTGPLLVGTPTDYVRRNEATLEAKISANDLLVLRGFYQKLGNEGFMHKPDTSCFRGSDIERRELTVMCMTLTQSHGQEMRVTLAWKAMEVPGRQWQMRIHDRRKMNIRPETGTLAQIGFALERFLVQCRADRQLGFDQLL